MKKVLLLIITFIMCVPFLVKAETCKVISGTGKDIGDEIKCGTESFYVVDHDDKQTKMLAKYNLLVGDNISQIEVDKKAPVYKNDYKKFLKAAKSYCKELVSTVSDKFYYSYPVYDMTFNLKTCRIYERVESEHVLQDSKAVGTFLKDGKSVLPLYGITYMNPIWGYEAIHDKVERENVYDEKGNLVLEGSSFKDYIVGYKEELKRQELKVEDVSFMTLDGFLSLIEKIHGSKVEVNLVYPEKMMDVTNREDFYIGKMDIKEYVPKEYNWVYDITYWVGSGFKNDGNGLSIRESEFNDYFISNEGFLCAIGRGECGYLEYPIGHGIRPVVTVLNENIEAKENKSKEVVIVVLIALLIFAIFSALREICAKKK